METTLRKNALQRALSMLMVLCMLFGLLPAITPPAEAAETSLENEDGAFPTSVTVSGDYFSIEVNRGLTPSFRLNYFDTTDDGVTTTHTLNYNASNRMNSAIAVALQDSASSSSDPQDPAFWQEPGISFDNPTGRSLGGTFTNTGSVSRSALFGSINYMATDDLINNDTGENGSDSRPDTVIMEGYAPNTTDVTIRLVVSLRPSASGKVDTCRYTIEARNTSETQAYAYGLAWTVDTQVGQGTGPSGAGDTAKFRGQGINKFTTGDLAVKFPTPNVYPWIDFQMPRGEPVNSTLFTNNNNIYQNSVPAFLYAVNRDHDHISAIFYPQIQNDRAYPGVTFRTADFVAMDNFSYVQNRYFYDIHASAARTELNLDSGHAVRYNPELLLPGQSLVFGIDYGMGQAVTVSENSPWLAVDIPQLKLEELTPGAGYGSERVTMNLRYGNGINATATYNDVVVRMFIDPTYLTPDTSMTTGSNAWVRNEAADAGGLQAWELQVSTTSNPLIPGADYSAVPPVYLVGTEVYADTNSATLFDGVETPLKFEMVIKDASYLGGTTADMKYDGEVELGTCESFSLNGVIWRDVNFSGTREGFEGVSGFDILLLDTSYATLGAATSAAQGAITGPDGIAAGQMQHVVPQFGNDYTYTIRGIKVSANDTPITSNIVPTDNHPIFETLSFDGNYTPSGVPALSYRIKTGQVAQIRYEFELDHAAVTDIYAYLQGTDKTDSSVTQPSGQVAINGGIPFAFTRHLRQRSVAGENLAVTYYAPINYRIAGTYALSGTQTINNLGSYAIMNAYTMDFVLVNKDVRLTGVTNTDSAPANPAAQNSLASDIDLARSKVILTTGDWNNQIVSLDFSHANISDNPTAYTWSIVSNADGIIDGGVSASGVLKFANNVAGSAVVKITSNDEPLLSHEMEIVMQTGTSATINEIYIARASDISTRITEMALVRTGMEDLVIVGRDSGTGTLTKLSNGAVTLTSAATATLTSTPSATNPYIFELVGVNGGYTSLSAVYVHNGTTLTTGANVLVTNHSLAGAQIRITPNPILLSSTRTEEVTYELVFSNGTTQVIPAAAVNPSVTNTNIAAVDGDTLTYQGNGLTDLTAMLLADNAVTGTAQIDAATGGPPIIGGAGTLRLQEHTSTGGLIPVSGTAEYFAYLDADGNGQYDAGETILSYSAINVSYASDSSRFTTGQGVLSTNNVLLTGANTGLDKLTVRYTIGSTTYSTSVDVLVHSAGLTYQSLTVEPSPLVLEVGASRSVVVYANFIGSGSNERHALPATMYTGAMQSGGTTAALAPGTQNQILGVSGVNEDLYTATLNSDSSKTGTSRVLVIPADVRLNVEPGVLWVKNGAVGTVTYTLVDTNGTTIAFANLTDYISATIYNPTVASFTGGNITSVSGQAVGRTGLGAYLSGQSSIEMVDIYVWDDTSGDAMAWSINPLNINAGSSGASELWLLDAGGTPTALIELNDLASLVVADTAVATIPAVTAGSSLLVTGQNVGAYSTTAVTATSPAGTAVLNVNVQSNIVIFGLEANPHVIELWPGEMKTVALADTGNGAQLTAGQLAALTSSWAAAGENGFTINPATHKLEIEQQGAIPLNGSVNVLNLLDGNTGEDVDIYIINYIADPYQADHSRELVIDPPLTSVELTQTAETAARLILINTATNTVVDNIILPSGAVTWQANTKHAMLPGRIALGATTAASQTVEITGTTSGAQTYNVIYSAGATTLTAEGQVFVYAQSSAGGNITAFDFVPSSMTLLVNGMETLEARITYADNTVQLISNLELAYAVPDLHSVDPATATVNTIGLITGKVVGATTAEGTLVDTALTSSAAITVASGWTISGVVTDASTALPLANAEVALGSQTVTTNASGEYTISAPNGTHVLTASMAGYSDNAATVTVSNGFQSNINIALAPFVAPACTVSGQVTDSVTNVPLAGATVTIQGTALTATTDSNGDYIINGVPDGTHIVEAIMVGYVSDFDTVTVNGANETGVDFALAPVVLVTYTVSGQVIDSVTNAPLVGATVTIQGTALTATTDSNGDYIINGVPDGIHIVEVVMAGYVSDSDTVTVNGANETGVDFALVSLGGAAYSVFGQVTDAVTGNPIVGAAITIAGQTVTTDNNGDYLVTNVPDGATLNAVATAAGYISGSISVTVAGGDVDNANIALNLDPTSMFTISGRIVDVSGVGISGAVVSISGLPNVTADAAGDYIVNGIVNGSYIISASASGYNSNSISRTVAGGNVSNADIILAVTNSGGIGSGNSGSTGGSSFTVTYDANGGTGNRRVTGIASGSEHTVLDIADTGISRTDMIFLRWNTQRDGAGTSYAANEKITVTANVTLHAQWGDGIALNTENHFAYMQGDDKGTFRPNDNMTRAETAQMLYNLLLDTSHSGSATFSDLPADTWYTEAVKTLAAKGIIRGYTDGTFRPDAPISRAEFVAMLSRFTSMSSGEMIFSDIPSNHWAYQHIVSATSKGWINGYPDGTFRPEQNIARAEAAKVTNGLLERSADEAYVNANASINRFPDVATNHWAYYEIMETTVSHEYSKTASGGEIWASVTKKA